MSPDHESSFQPGPDSDWGLVQPFQLLWCDLTLSGELGILRLEASEFQAHLAVPPKSETAFSGCHCQP